MSEAPWVRVYRFVFGVLAIVAIIAKYFRDDDSIGNWISLFTVQSNALAGIVLLAGVFFRPSVLHSPRWDRIRGAAVMYLVMTFIVYGVLINGFDNPLTTSRHWTHTVLHQVMPVVMVLDLLIRPIVHRLSWRTIVPWSTYPVVFLAYSLIRGPIAGWYPYDFIDPAEVGGYDGVALYSLAITVGFVGLGSLVLLGSRVLRRTSMSSIAPQEPLPADAIAAASDARSGR